MRTRSQASDAFTLAELLLAISITVIIVVLLGRVFTATATQWQAADQRIDTFRDARAALQIIAHDLSRANLNGDEQMLSLRDIAPDDTYAREAFAVTPIRNSGKSDLCAVGYYLSWSEATKTFTLKRLFRNSDITMASLARPSVDFMTLFAKTATLEEDVATYAWDLQFRPGVDAAAENVIVHRSTEWQWVEVRFKAMSAASARKLAGLPVDRDTWSDETSPLYRTAILPYEQHFVSRIKLDQAK